MCLLSAVCGRHSYRLFPSCHDGSGLSVLIQSHCYWSFCTPQKASVGMYSRCNYLLFVYFLILPSLLHSSILFNCFYTCIYIYTYIKGKSRLVSPVWGSLRLAPITITTMRMRVPGRSRVIWRAIQHGAQYPEDGICPLWQCRELNSLPAQQH